MIKSIRNHFTLLGQQVILTLLAVAICAMAPAGCSTAQLATSTAYANDVYSGATMLMSLAGTSPTVAKIEQSVISAATNPKTAEVITAAENVATLAANIAGVVDPSVGIPSIALVAAGTQILNQGLAALQGLKSNPAVVATPAATAFVWDRRVEA